MLELELGLSLLNLMGGGAIAAPSISIATAKRKRIGGRELGLMSLFDLNTTTTTKSYVELSDDEYEYDDDGSTSTALTLTGVDTELMSKKKKKKKQRLQHQQQRIFDDAFQGDDNNINNQSNTILLWNKQPPKEDDDDDPNRNCPNFAINRNREEGRQFVGWPPIKSYRGRNIINRNQINQNRINRHQLLEEVDDRIQIQGGGNNSVYVKVQVQGFLITRKVDITLYRQYYQTDTLVRSLLALFVNRHDSLQGYYRLAYQDKNDYRNLAKDVPWRYFIQSVQRLKLLRKEEQRIVEKS